MSMDLRVGFIGGGAMAEAIVVGITQGTVSRENIYVSDHKAARCQQLAEQYGIHASVGADSFLGHVDVLFLRLHIKGRLGAVDLESSHGLEPVPQDLHHGRLELVAVEALQGHLALIAHNDLTHRVSPLL